MRPPYSVRLSAELARAVMAGYAAFGARTGKHDDLVLALALALWWLGSSHGISFEQHDALL